MPRSGSERKYSALIVDDERLARLRIRELLDEHASFDSISECSDGQAAVEYILSAPVDLVFLDIQMPEVDGFDVIDLVGHDRMPGVIFVTAYDQFAVKAFDVHAIDYLLKPFDKERFYSAVDRALQSLHSARAGMGKSTYSKLLAHVHSNRTPAERILIESAGHVTILRTEQIDWAESAGNYVKIHSGKEQFLVRRTMKDLLNELSPERFVRIHRTTLVNLEQIKEIQPYFHGDAIVVLQNGTKLRVSRARRKILERSLKGA